MKCKNCGYESNWLSGSQIEKKYGITVVFVPVGHLCSLICLCGHHAKHHKYEGTMGICLKCSGVPVHNFIPKDHSKRDRITLKEKKNNGKN